MTFASSEGIIPAPESNHAVHGAVRHTLQAKEAGEEKPSFSTCPETWLSTK